MNNNFKISIIIPYYNGESFYHHLLSSIRKSLETCFQFGYNYELITIIDSVETHEEAVVQIANAAFKDMPSVNIVIKKNDNNIGVAGSRNVALTIAKGEFIHIIDQDDLVSVDFYSKVISLLFKYNFVLVNGEIRYTSKKFNTHKLYYFKPLLNINGLLKDDYIRSPGQIVFSKNLCNQLWFPEPKKYKGTDDRFFWICLFLINKSTIEPIYLADPVYIANIHDNNYSSDKVNLRKSALESWVIIQKQVNLDEYKRLVINDQIRLTYLLKDKVSYVKRIKGGYLSLQYFLKPNKVLRFLIKRI